MNALIAVAVLFFFYSVFDIARSYLGRSKPAAAELIPIRKGVLQGGQPAGETRSTFVPRVFTPTEWEEAVRKAEQTEGDQPEVEPVRRRRILT
jgi:hypothetical protein